MSAAKSSKRVVLITGCSPGGIGFALAKEFHSRGLHVIATARDVSKLGDLASLGDDMTTLRLDVTSEESVTAAKRIVEELTGGRLDILVNNAGRPYAMPALDLDISEAQALYEVNLFGVMRMVKSFSPLLMSTAAAHPSLSPLILQIGSINGINPYPFGSVYNSSKAALHAYSNTLRVELAPFGIRVMVAITGGVISSITSWHPELPASSPYMPIKEGFDERTSSILVNAMRADVYARGVVSAALKSKPPKSFWRGKAAGLVRFISAFLGRGVLDYLMGRRFGLPYLTKMIAASRKNDAKKLV